MRSVNKVILIGNVTRDPELKTTPNGQPIATFGVATNREWTTSEGEKKSLAEFHSIVVWGRLAELCAKLVKKGKLVYIEGYLKTRSWDNESGVKSYRTEIVASDVIFLSPKDKDVDMDIQPQESQPGTEDEVATGTPDTLDTLDNLF